MDYAKKKAQKLAVLQRRISTDPGAGNGLARVRASATEGSIYSYSLALDDRDRRNNNYSRASAGAHAGKAERLKELEKVFGISAAPVTQALRQREYRRMKSAEPVAPSKGWPKSATYRVEELVSWWRFQLRRFFPKVDMPAIYWKKERPVLLKWLKSDRWRTVEAVVEYACEQWKAIRNRFDRLFECEVPTLMVIYGYRESLKRALNGGGIDSKRPQHRSKWRMAQWETDEAGYSEEILESI